MSKKLQSEFAPKFKIGDKVRVKHEFMDVDYPDMPMGGWAGTVKDVQGSTACNHSFSLDEEHLDL